jgi:hypothetical protein
MKYNSEILSRLSIRARLAYGTHCLEIALKETANQSDILDSLLKRIWEFCNLPMLENWHSEVYEMSPYCILDTTENAIENFKYINKEQALKLKEEYLRLPPFIVEITDEVIRIGINNMYSGVIGNSIETLEPLICIVKLMEENNITLPKIDAFLKSPFDEDGGWGDPHLRTFYING